MIGIGDKVIRFCQKKAKAAMYLSITTFVLSFLFYHPLVTLINIGCAGIIIIAWIPILKDRMRGC